MINYPFSINNSALNKRKTQRHQLHKKHKKIEVTNIKKMNLTNPSLVTRYASLFLRVLCAFVLKFFAVLLEV